MHKKQLLWHELGKKPRANEKQRLIRWKNEAIRVMGEHSSGNPEEFPTFLDYRQSMMDKYKRMLNVTNSWFSLETVVAESLINIDPPHRGEVGTLNKCVQTGCILDKVQEHTYIHRYSGWYVSHWPDLPRKFKWAPFLGAVSFVFDFVFYTPYPHCGYGV